MKKIWNGWLRESVFLYCVFYTVVTILNSVLYLTQGIRNDPNGNWHELTRAIVVLIGIVAYEMAKNLPIKNMLLRAVVIYIPTMALTLGFVWLNQFIEPLAESAYRDILINYTGLYLTVSLIVALRQYLKKKKNDKV
jgi:hypothetical protein